MTVDAVTGSFLARSVVNTAQVHWNDRADRDEALGSGFVVFGLITASTVLGLASQDATEHVVAELGYDDFRFLTPVYQGDTLYALTEVLAVHAATDRSDAGVVEFAHWGLNQDDTLVFKGRRTVLIARRLPA
nr:MaoC/PaaZ C-terminal domain-containing protein [Nocardioides humi]